ncbi:MAG: 8-oxo-dGTP diphosphatase [Veillonellaceae bacterium]|nr:8-oxo-dGTP diphosphatase [Veillonellaceae bacterium]
MEATTLVFVRRGGEILLGRKLRGFGRGKWNGFGGKLRPGETVTAGALRELAEEAGLTALAEDLVRIADLQFDFTAAPELNHPAAVFVLERYAGEPVRTEEMEPRWFPQTELPYTEMWAADAVWLPQVLAGNYVRGRILFAADGETVLATTWEDA